MFDFCLYAWAFECSSGVVLNTVDHCMALFDSRSTRAMPLCENRRGDASRQTERSGLRQQPAVASYTVEIEDITDSGDGEDLPIERAAAAEVREMNRTSNSRQHKLPDIVEESDDSVSTNLSDGSNDLLNDSAASLDVDEVLYSSLGSGRSTVKQAVNKTSVTLSDYGKEPSRTSRNRLRTKKIVTPASTRPVHDQQNSGQKQTGVQRLVDCIDSNNEDSWDSAHNDQVFGGVLPPKSQLKSKSAVLTTPASRQMTASVPSGSISGKKKTNSNIRMARSVKSSAVDCRPANNVSNQLPANRRSCFVNSFFGGNCEEDYGIEDENVVGDSDSNKELGVTSSVDRPDAVLAASRDRSQRNNASVQSSAAMASGKCSSGLNVLSDGEDFVSRISLMRRWICFFVLFVPFISSIIAKRGS